MRTHWLDSVMDKSVARMQRQQRRLVVGGRQAARKALLIDAALALGALALWITYVWSEGTHSLWRSLIILVLGWTIGTAAFGKTKRANTYRSGWLDGRQAMLMGMQEAQQRGLKPHEWAAGEMERDAFMLGLPIWIEFVEERDEDDDDD